MSATRQADILRQLESSGASDGELLARFVASRDPGAFEELVRRHGALVLGVCRRVTGHPQDAEDAFQAVFLVLAQKAGLLRVTGRLGNWLYGVAYRVSLRARRAAGRRKAREVTMSNPPEVAAPPSGAVQPELLSVLDAELAALPAHYRDAIVLCDLQGASREDAATALGIPEGTLSSRLANGRKKLAARLTKHGVALSVATVSLALVEARGETFVPAELVSRTAQLAADVAAGGAVPRALAHLLNGGSAVRKMLVVSAALAVVTGAVFAARPNAETPQEVLPNRPKVEGNPQPPIVGMSAPAFTNKPKLQRAFDTGFSFAFRPVWDNSGTYLAVCGRRSIEREQKNENVLCVFSLKDQDLKYSGNLSPNEIFMGVAPGGRIVTQHHEDHLISGRNRLKVWTPSSGNGTVTNNLVVKQSIDLDVAGPRIRLLVAHGEGYRAVAFERDASGKSSKLEVIEVAANGAITKSLLRADAGEPALSPDGKRFAVVTENTRKVAVYDLDRVAKAFEYAFPAPSADEPVGDSTRSALAFSPQGRRLVVSCGIGRTCVLDCDAGKPLAELEGAAQAETFPREQAFSANGHLLALANTAYKAVKRVRDGKDRTLWDSVDSHLTVWDVRTGKVLKSWNRGNLGVAFNPGCPTLVIAEHNGNNDTRLGFWDFSAEVEKK